MKKAELNKRGIKDFSEWNKLADTLYIGRNMNFYIPGAHRSKWANPFSVKKYGLDECLILYEDYVRNNQELWGSLEELKGKELGCWCKPNRCHGEILIKLFNEKY